MNFWNEIVKIWNEGGGEKQLQAFKVVFNFFVVTEKKLKRRG
jgi:hypothetical protein